MTLYRELLDSMTYRPHWRTVPWKQRILVLEAAIRIEPETDDRLSLLWHIDWIIRLRAGVDSRLSPTPEQPEP